MGQTDPTGTMPFNGPIAHDIQGLEKAGGKGENQFESIFLDRISNQYLGESKKGEEMDAYLIQHFGKKNPTIVIASRCQLALDHMLRNDVDGSFRIFPQQKKELEKQEAIICVGWRAQSGGPTKNTSAKCGKVDWMPRRGLDEACGPEHNKLIKQIKRSTGIEVSVWAASSVAKVFDHLGLSYPLTPKTQKPSFSTHHRPD